MGEEKTTREKKGRGGVRAGAGHFSDYGEETTMLNFRVPKSKKEEIKNKLKPYLDAILEDYKINKNNL